jgi:hypothetical protein
MIQQFSRIVPFLLALLSSASALAQWQTLTLDLTRNDSGAYTTDLPAASFTPDGLKLPLKGGETYSLMGKRSFTGDYDFDLQVEVTGRSESGTVEVDLLLVNETKQRKVVATYLNQSVKGGNDSGFLRYFKDGKATGFNWNGNWHDFSRMVGYGEGHFEWLRIHKELKKVWFMARVKGDQYGWNPVANYPRPTFFNEDTDEFTPGFTVRASPDFSGTLHIKTVALRGDLVLPRNTAQREFHFDFGPVSQELEDDFSPVSEFSMYSKEKGYGWIIPEPEKVWRGEVPQLSDEDIVKAGLVPVRHQKEDDWKAGMIQQAYWMQVNDKKHFFSVAHGGDYVEFYKQWLDLKTPLERDLVAMAKPYHFQIDPMAIKDTEERRGSLYIDDDLSTEFAVDLPNGNYNIILGVGYNASLLGGGETSTYNLEIEGKVRKQSLGPNWRRPNQFPVRNVLVEDGQMNFRFFCDLRKAMDKYYNHDVGIQWMINYILILPAEQKELMNEWEWKIIKRRGEIIRRVTFVDGKPAVTKNEGNFISLNGKPYYFLKVMNNYHPGTTEHFSYYCLSNDISAFHSVRGSQHFFKPDWEKLSYSDDYPWDTVDRMNVAFSWGILTTLHQDTILSFVPHAVSGEGNPTVDSRGRSNRYNVQPPLNSALGKEIQREAYTMMANQLATHPGNAGHFVYEELWHPDEAGYDEQSLIQYWDWLQRKYSTIEKLNQEWGTAYKGFDEILQPKPEGKEFWEFTPEFVNFRKFRGWAQREMVRHAYEMIKKNEPTHFAWGAKGDFGTQSFYTGPFLDMFGWYEPYVAASVARYFGRAAISGGYQLNCEHAYLDGRKQADHKPGPRKYIGRDETVSIYNKIVSSVFKGSKGFFNEWYSDGMSHIFHRTTMIADKGPKFQVMHWTGQLTFYDQPAYEGPPVNIDRGPLFASRANQMLYRLGHLWLPATPLVPRVLIPTTEASFFLDLINPKPYADFEEVALRLLRSSNLPVDFLALEAVADLSQYQLIVLSDTTQAISQHDADRIRQFVQNGGKLILMNAGGFTNDERPRRYNKDEVFPLQAFADLGGYRLRSSNPWHMPIGRVSASFASSDIAPEFSDGQPLGEWDTNYYYEATGDSQVFLKGRLAPSKGGDALNVALGLLNKNRNVAVVSFPPKGASDEMVQPLFLAD